MLVHKRGVTITGLIALSGVIVVVTNYFLSNIPGMLLGIGLLIFNIGLQLKIAFFEEEV